jgi:hypothetical protein
VPGYAFNLEVLKQVAVELRRSEDGGDASLLNSPFARLGAFGPDLLLYAPPIDTLAADLADESILKLVAQDIRNLNATDLKTLEDLFQKPVGSAYSALFSNVVIPMWPDLIEVISFIQQAANIAQTQDTGALKGFFAEIPTIKNALTNLGTNLAPGVKTMLSLATLITGGPWMEVAPALAALVLLLPKSSTEACRPYEFLRWHKSGQFAQSLWNNAATDNQKAFALGWMSHVAAAVTGEPFVNNIVGGPYRTHWWRNRLASNFVDAWTFGFYEEGTAAGATFPSMSGDTPTPAYEDWAPLYGANLQNLFDVGNLEHSVTNGIPDAVTAMSQGEDTTGNGNLMTTLAAQFPAELTTLLSAAIADTYPAHSQPAMPPELTAAGFANAYVGAYAVYWFLTSGDGPLGNNALGPPPSTSCGTTPPSWTTSSSSSPPQSGSVINQSGSPVCDAILAILAVLSFLTGNVAAGIGFTIAALEEIPSASINWPAVQCDVYWIESLTDKLVNALRDALWIMTLAYPPPIMLGGTDTNGDWEPATDWTNVSTDEDPPANLPDNEPPAGGVPLTKTNAASTGRGGNVAAGGDGGEYPRGLDKGPGPDGKPILPDLDFFRYPLPAPLETDSSDYTAQDGIPADLYPNSVVNGMGLSNGGMLQSSTTFPSQSVPFGDAVSNALQLIKAKADGLPDYNLDGDRGYGWLGWHPKALSDPATLPVQVEQD